MPDTAEHSVYVDTSQLVKLRHEARGFSFLPKQPIGSLLSGRKRSRLRGRGLDFEELRHYRPGDDIRSMDWRVTNRTGKPHVRVYTEERDRPVLFVVDQRLSMFFGSQIKMKSVAASELTALGAWRVLDQGDRVGAILFNNHQIRHFSPARSQSKLIGLLSQLAVMNQSLNAERSAAATVGLADGIALAERTVGHDYLVVIISDFDGWDNQSLVSIKRIAQHNDVVAGLIYDPLEVDISEAADLVVSDGHYQLQLRPQERDLGRKFEQSFQSQLGTMQAALRKHDIPVLTINTVDAVIQQLRSHIGRR